MVAGHVDIRSAKIEEQNVGQLVLRLWKEPIVNDINAINVPVDHNPLVHHRLHKELVAFDTPIFPMVTAADDTNVTAGGRAGMKHIVSKCSSFRIVRVEREQ